MRCRKCLTLFSDSETSFSLTRCLTSAPDAHKVWLSASQFQALHCVTNGGMTRAAKSALNTGCVSDYLQYLCPFNSSSVCSPAALKTKLCFFFFFFFKGRKERYSVGDCERDVCDFNQVSEWLEIPTRTRRLLFSLMDGDSQFTSVIVVLDLWLER